METYYLIDYENVGGEGLGGCEQLNESDHILIFFTRNAKTIDMRGIANHGSARLDMIEVPAGKQSTDIHIGSYLGYLAGIKKADECRIVIVSKDTDYDNVRRFWTEKTGIEAERTGRIVGSAPKKQAEKKPAQPEKKPAQLQKKEQTQKAAPRKAQSTAAAGEDRARSGQNPGPAQRLSREQQENLERLLRQAVAEARLEQAAGDSVVKLTRTYFGQEHYLNKIHNDLQKQNPENGTKVYETVKPVLTRFEARLKGKRAAALQRGTGHPEAVKKPAAAAPAQKAVTAPAPVVTGKKGVMSSLRRILGKKN